ncbi:peptidase M28 [Sphingomonas sp. Leaf407]|uniref:M20/M25/M40 family metallo-hydrolase n=1 Tax=unclassified Sphingomonas TaxID=196159 RepID=UPI0006FEA020|nr:MULTISPECIES: M20/M25/M40 family metallo-hydrolase [unclassified Sphingomonas]KQN40667.1 peptidase M28 [Sphingomonas sp. Leaf42]KQT30023.1 peptidase M28 [Sphingomonas sp. Leaf407]
MRHFLLLPALALSFPAIARDAPRPERLRADVATLVGFGTRHTASDPDHATRGIGAARRWFADALTRIGSTCGNCITVANIARGFSGPRAPNGVNVVDVLGFQQGRDPKRVVIVMGHIDSRVSDVMNATSDAPGANDDASGVALVLETARILSREKFDATIVYAALSGEEQGLWGAQLLADTAKERGWTVTAVLNNDIVGNTIGQDGRRIADRVRVFSEGIRASESIEQQIARRAAGGEDDGPSRALAKTVDTVAATLPGGLDAFLDRRPDRFGRGGDHEPFLKLGYPAVRFSVGVENYDAQHQDLRRDGTRIYGDTIDRMDFPYLAKVTALNVATIARLAAAPAAPATASIEGALATDTTVRWAAVPGAAGYRIRWRRNDAQDWRESHDVTGTEAVLKGVIVDDHFVAVSALSALGAESIATFAGRGSR